MFGRRKVTSTRIDTLLGKTANLQGDLEFSGGINSPTLKITEMTVSGKASAG